MNFKIGSNAIDNVRYLLFEHPNPELFCELGDNHDLTAYDFVSHLQPEITKLFHEYSTGITDTDNIECILTPNPLCC